jgi:hypothetical protein
VGEGEGARSVMSDTTRLMTYDIVYDIVLFLCFCLLISLLVYSLHTARLGYLYVLVLQVFFWLGSSREPRERCLHCASVILLGSLFLNEQVHDRLFTIAGQTPIREFSDVL